MGLLVGTPPTALGQDVRPSEPIPIDSLALAAVDTIPILAPRFEAGGGLEQLANVPSEDRLPRNPRNAAIRAFLIPGWGQLYAGHPWRGVVFASAEIGFFLAATQKQSEALDLKDDLRLAREAFFASAPDSLLADPVAAENAFDATPEAVSIRSMLESVEERREDFYAYFAVSVLFAAIDAYVSTQLDPLRLGIEPRTGRVRAGVELPLGRRRASPR